MAEEVKGMFARIARRYDLLNDLLSFGIHRAWKEKTIRLAGAAPGKHALDCATGTGDLAFSIAKKVEPGGSVAGIDFTPEMLEIAKHRDNTGNTSFSVADVMKLPFEDNSFDFSTIAFGIRNVDDPRKGIDEMARCTRPGGTLAVLEFGKPQGLMAPIYSFYSRFIIPPVGKIFSGDFDAYSYLNRTSLAFPCREDFLEIMRSTGRFSELSYTPVTFGIAYIYLGKVR